LAHSPTRRYTSCMETILKPEQEELLKRTRDVLGRLRDALADAGAPPEDRTALADSIRQLDELFLLVVAGEFNAGKSAFINALLGRALLAEGVTPTTTQIYLLKYGPEPSTIPAEKGVWIQTAPIELLQNVNIVDTPGTNAIQREHEALTAEFIPRSDLVLFLTSADRPFTESERAFLTQIRDWGKKIVLIINKVDILDGQTAVDQVVDFAAGAANRLVGDIAAVFPVSARLARQAKAGQPRLWPASGFEPLESFIHDTLDDDGRFRLKLLNPLGVGQKLVSKQLAAIGEDLAALQDDNQLLEDIRGQTVYYNEDMQRNFQARLGEIDNLLYAMEKRGRDFFDETIRVGRIPDLVRANRVKEAFEQQVVADTPQQIEARIGELVDWLVEQDLRQWTAVAEHLARRKQEYDERIVGHSGPREGTLAYDRQRLVDSIGAATRQAVASYDREKEAAELANSAQTAVAGAALLELGGMGISTVVALLATATWLDVTGILAGVAFMALGFLVLPARKRRANQELERKLADLRHRLVGSLTEQFNREMRRGAQRLEDTVAPFDRFVRTQQARLVANKNSLADLEKQIGGLRNQLKQ
ncbi:MAG: dynamin family protein, partial [Chloroflexi bacterium]|nr:dynamin family protein [Chloroflexota bacterium]